MKPYKVSKRVQHGTLVTKWGGYIVPYSGKRGQKLLGVWQIAQKRIYRNPDMSLIVIKTPSAIQVSGPAEVHE